jgi:hypothetical protein
MGLPSKYLPRIVALGFAGAILLAAGCSITAWLPNNPSARIIQASNGATAFLNAIGALFLIGAVITMAVWAVKSVRS